MSLRVTKTNPCLERKLKIGGFEVVDLLAIFLLISVLNLLTGPLNMRAVTVWIPSFLLAATLWISKRGKPDNYLVHFIRFHVKPKRYEAFSDGGKTDRRILAGILKPRHFMEGSK